MAKYVAILVSVGLGCSLAFLPTQGFARTEPVYTGTFSNVAASGYDPVAYFVSVRSVKGNAGF